MLFRHARSSFLRRGKVNSLPPGGEKKARRNLLRLVARKRPCFCPRPPVAVRWLYFTRDEEISTPSPRPILTKAFPRTMPAISFVRCRAENRREGRALRSSFFPRYKLPDAGREPRGRYFSSLPASLASMLTLSPDKSSRRGLSLRVTRPRDARNPEQSYRKQTHLQVDSCASLFPQRSAVCPLFAGYL